MAEEKDIVGVHEVQLLQRPQRLLVAVEFGIEVHVPEGTSLAVAAAGPLDPHRDVTVPGQVAGDPGEAEGCADRVIDGETGVPALEQHHGRVAPFGFRAGDDGPKPGAVARHGAVDDVVSVTLLAGHLLELHPFFDSHAVTDHLQGEHVSGAGLFNPLEEHGDAGDLDPADREDHVTGLEIAVGGGGVGENLLKHDPAVPVELLAVSDLPGHGCELRPEHGPTTQFVLGLRLDTARQGRHAGDHQQGEDYRYLAEEFHGMLPISGEGGRRTMTCIDGLILCPISRTSSGQTLRLRSDTALSAIQAIPAAGDEKGVVPRVIVSGRSGPSPARMRS